MLNQLSSLLAFILFFVVGIVSIVKPLLIWDIGWGWWLKHFGDVKESHRAILIRSMGSIYLALLALLCFDYFHIIP